MSENLLKHETSPYLLQHAENPVHWRPWGPEALAEAQRENKPILLSVGYAACHWCHVMAHESFEDPGTARWMNDLFVNIKVDREERPDVDQLYMAALHQLGEQGGWPLTMFLAPDGRPFWGGTYFPKEARWGRPGFVSVLKEVSRLFHEEPSKIDQNREALTQRLSAAGADPARLSPDIVPAISDKLIGLIDPVNGGLKGAPKFPQTPMLDLIWRAGLMSGLPQYAAVVVLSLRQIARGGIYDHLGGGFARYSVDDRWLVPHFEKMLYDNAQLIDLMTSAWLHSGDDLFRIRIEETVAWLEREMIAEGGAFAASLDADSEGEEGKFYVWDKAEVDRLLGSEANLFCDAYDITAEGNSEGKSIPNRLSDPFPRDADEERRLSASRAVLFAAREPRIRPGRDDKVLADWNGLTIAALARASVVFDRPEWRALAERAYRFICESMAPDGRLAHACRAGKLTWPGFSSDYAAMMQAALALHDATGNPERLRDAIGFADLLEAWHIGEDGSYRLAASDAADVVIRMRSGTDEATANPNGVAAAALVRLSHLTGESRFMERADRIIAALGADIAQNPLGHASLLSALALRTTGLQVVIVGDPEDPETARLRATARSVPDPNLSLIEIAPGQDLPPGHPATGKTANQGRPAAFVCRGETCSLPVTEPAELAALIQSGGAPASA
ncbi:thioredoxin domain-containing protein [Microbaculum marinum]|uniref:Thioredoxin domain-containing protein n=1 Tax=Microbaculum marinum TaxID=1764581 RepID=A0AAW9S348_9HYPH